MELLPSLKTFVRVSEIGSFTAVATELGVAPSLVSRQLSSLEEYLGARLAHRSTRAISMTDEGLNLIPLARRVLDAAETLQHAVSRRRDVAAGCVRLGVPVALAAYISCHLGDLLRRYEELSIDLVVHETSANLVETGLDLDIQIGDIGDSPMIMRRLGSAAAAVVAAPAYLDSRPVPMHPHDLLSHECIVDHAWQPDSFWRFDSAGGACAIAVRGRIRTNNADAVRRAALAGCGIALLPHVQVQQDIRDGRLVALLSGFRPHDLTLSVVYPSRRNMPLRTRAVLDFLVDLPWDNHEATAPAASHP